jgi:fumarate reductase flavoprotein subunit
MFLETRVKSIVRTGDKITGVIVEDNEGKPIHVKCRAVLCSTGGYGDKREWVEKYCKAGKYIKSFSDQQQTGDAIKMAWDVGATAEGMGVMQAFTFPVNEQVNTQLFAVGIQANLWVNEKGERFTNESNIWSFPVITNAVSRQPHATAYNIFDQDMVTFLREDGIQISMGEYLVAGSKLDNIDAELERGINESKIFAADTIDELAGKINMPSKTLEESVTEYNACCDKNYDFVMAKDRCYLHAIKKPKFYAAKLGIVIGITEGGIKVNHRMEVIDNDFNVIPGLYAGGCSAGGMIGDTYIMITTGGSASFAVNSGRMAGESILSYLGK